MQVVSETEGATWMDGPVGPLEARVELPRASDVGVDLVICHPHPLYGGTLDNKVVHTLARAGRDVGLRAVRFNFRGVGGSVGAHDQGRGEVDDLLAVLAAAEASGPGRRRILAGFSFGAWITAQAAARLQTGAHAPLAVLLVAPPVHYEGFDALPALTAPTLIIQGEADDVVDAVAVRDWAARRQPAAELRMLSTGHFFHGALPELKDLVAAWLGGVSGR